MNLIPDVNEEDTDVESPPEAESPHVTTESCFNAANATPLEYIACTPDVNDEDTELESPPHLLRLEQ